MNLPASVIGVGVDIVGIERFAAILQRTPTFVDRVFTEMESRRPDGTLRSAQSLAARFAAKEAVAKVLVAGHGLRWHDCQIATTDQGAPRLVVTGTVQAAAREAGIATWHLSLSHDGGLAIAFVVAEGMRQ